MRYAAQLWYIKNKYKIKVIKGGRNDAGSSKKVNG